MRLWTWQKQGFHIADKSRQVESLENSIFLNDGIDSEHFKQVYNKLYQKLETSQFHWYFTDVNEAKNCASHLQWFARGHVLWEVDVPVGMVFRKVCTIAWTYLLNRAAVPRRLQSDWLLMSKYDQGKIKKWEHGFDDFWKRKSEGELWDALFLEMYVDGCTDILLHHPLHDSWIIRDPLKEGKWWEMYKGNVYGPKSYDRVLPCDECATARLRNSGLAQTTPQNTS